VIDAIQSSRAHWLSFAKPWTNYQIVLEEEGASTRTIGCFPEPYAGGKSEPFIEKKQGLLLSRRGRAAAYFLGGVWIPKQLADYEFLKRLALSFSQTVYMEVGSTTRQLASIVLASLWNRDHCKDRLTHLALSR
jgi:hypothetical protein